MINGVRVFGAGQRVSESSISVTCKVFGVLVVVVFPIPKSNKIRRWLTAYSRS